MTQQVKFGTKLAPTGGGIFGNLAKRAEEAPNATRGIGITKRALERAQAQQDAAVEADTTLGAERADAIEAGIAETLAAIKAEGIKGEGIEYDVSQLRALEGILKQRVSCLIGAAGTGKTTVERVVAARLWENLGNIEDAKRRVVQCENPNGGKPLTARYVDAKKYGWKIIDGEDEAAANKEIPAIAFASFTGRAAQQMKRALPEELHLNVSTVHRLLGYAPVWELKEVQDKTGMLVQKDVMVFRPTFDKLHKLPFLFYVLDEVSMLDTVLFNQLVDAMPDEARILLIGDINQLPAVAGKSVLGYAMEKWPTYELTTIHRQAADNPIIANAHKILRGQLPEDKPHFRIIGNRLPTPGKPGVPPCPSGSEPLPTYFLQIIDALSKKPEPGQEGVENPRMCFDPLRDQIIVPKRTKEAPHGCTMLNEHLSLMFNPERKVHGVIVNKRITINTGNGQAFYAVGDKVMLTMNVNDVSPPLTNGMMGVIESIEANGNFKGKAAQDSEESLNLSSLELSELDDDDFNLSGGLSGFNPEVEEEEKKLRQGSHIVTVRFETGQTYTFSSSSDYNALEFGYAITCHKAQGGEYPNVVILVHSADSNMLSQEWLYTAVTRARQNVYLVCNQRGLLKAVTRQVIVGRTLQEKIASFNALSRSIKGFVPTNAPVLFEPREVV